MRRRVYLNPDLCTGCTLCMAACSAVHFGVVSPARSAIRVVQDLDECWEMQFLCRHCDEPHCLDACIAGLIKRDEESGLVTNDPERCVACWSCLMACPFGAIVRAPVGEGGREAAVKCDGCAGRDEPACVMVCPTGALVVYTGEADANGESGGSEGDGGVSASRPGSRGGSDE